MSITTVVTGKHRCFVCDDMVDIKVDNPVATRYYCANCWGMLVTLKNAEVVTSTMTSVKLRKLVKSIRRKKLDEIRHQTV